MGVKKLPGTNHGELLPIKDIERHAEKCERGESNPHTD